MLTESNMDDDSAVSLEEENAMLERIPDAEQMTALVGKPLYEVWNQLCALIDKSYDMERLWNKGGKAWTYEYKYRS